VSTLQSGGEMKSDNVHNELYKLAIRMAKLNGKSVRKNLELLLNTLPVRKNNTTATRR
jgi:hypothetical protein